MTFVWSHYSRLLTLATAAAGTEYTRGNSAPRYSGGTAGDGPPRYSRGTAGGGAPRYSGAGEGGAPRYSGAGEGGAPWYTIGALSRYARARHEVGTRFLQHETMRVRPASLARHGAVCYYLAQYYDVSFS